MADQPTEESGPGEVKPNDATAASDRVPAMVDCIVKEFDPLRIILFGSHARGDANRWSDVDLLVVFPVVSDKREVTVAIRRSLRDFGVPKDVVVTDQEEIARRGDLIGSVLRPALREGRVVYERN